MFANTPAFSGFAVDDLQRAHEFYAETLGLRVSRENEQMPLLTLHLAGDRDTLVYEKHDLQPANYTILNFEVDDVEAALQKAESLGGTRMMGPDKMEDPPITIALFTDPEGHVIGLVK